MQIAKLMHADVITCRDDDRLDRAAQLMWEHDLGCLPVVDQTGTVIGVVTDRDACMAAYTRGDRLIDIPVGVAMASPAVTCQAGDDIHRVEEIMRERQIRRMPVVDEGGRPLAMISLNDLARASARGSVPATEVASTLAAICAPRELSPPTA